MKKLLLSTIVSALCLSASAGVSFPNDFVKNFGEGSNPLEGWTVYAPEGRPGGSFTQFFPNYSPDNAVQIMVGTIPGVWSLSQYANGLESDTWIITPSISVTADTELLAYTVEVYGMNSSVTNNYEIYVSESGVAKEDFTLLESGTIKGSSQGADKVASTSKRVTFSGYGGKKIHLAFVNRGNTVGVLGFGEITLGSWYARGYPGEEVFGGLLYERSDSPQSFNISFPMRIATPVEAAGFKVDFTTSEGYEYSYEETRKLRANALSSFTIQTPEVPFSNDLDYTLAVTPNFEGAKSAVFTGSIAKASRDYDPVGVIEEGTGTWCGWCPYGAAGLNYYSNLYNGINGKPKVIPIAIHNGISSYPDPMEIPSEISDYAGAWLEDQNEEGGFPFAVVNRVQSLTPSPNPTYIGSLLENVYANKSFGKVTLDKVYYLPEESASVAAVFSITTSFNTAYAPVKASVIVTEDDVQGKTLYYTQNSFVSDYGDNETTIAKRMGEDWVPYFEPYFGVTQVAPKDMVYTHVARGAFPSYDGVLFDNANAGEPTTGRIVFDMPSTVLIKENTSVIVLLTLQSTGQIIGADELSFNDYTFESGVEKVVENSNILASLRNGTLSVTVDGDAEVEAYGIDGTKLLSAKATSGTNTFDLTDASGIVIVNVKSNAAARQYKFINR